MLFVCLVISLLTTTSTTTTTTVAYLKNISKDYVKLVSRSSIKTSILLSAATIIKSAISIQLQTT